METEKPRVANFKSTTGRHLMAHKSRFESPRSQGMIAQENGMDATANPYDPKTQSTQYEEWEDGHSYAYFMNFEGKI
jgi:hypothetical protein